MGKNLGVKNKSFEAESISTTLKATGEQVSNFVPDFFEQLVGFSLSKSEQSQKSPEQPLVI
ncbi:MAG TPA: hypothetical protein VF810_02060, partial [Patescibacteria group bacterium]